jgi:protocatechuate 3,4-dioxygenase beta subunit
MLLLLLLIAAPVAAENQVTLQVAVTSSNQNIAADGQDSATITVTVMDSAGTAIKLADVVLTVSSPWSLKDSVGETRNDGTFATSFLPTTMSGNATITATVTGTTSSGVLTGSASYDQVIVGSDPAKALSLYSDVGTVGSQTSILVLVLDKNGNPVSSKKKVHQVIFNTSTNSDNAIVNTVTKKNGKGLSVLLNDSGYAAVDFLLSTKPGMNYLVITPPSPLPQELITIHGIPNAVPTSITQKVTPVGNPPTLVTGSSYFVIDYRLTDAWGNPSAGQSLSVSVNTGEKIMVESNSNGNVSISYGPKNNAGLYLVTAQAVNYPTLVATQTLQFVNGTPFNMILTASPQSMASLDVKSDSSAVVTAKVIDLQGNPVPGKTVSFSIQRVNNGTFIQTQGPSLRVANKKTSTIGDEIAAVTDSSGHAFASFTPGAFITDGRDPSYSPMAEGVALVRARWTSDTGDKTVTHDINLSYKNYPYLSVFTSVNPGTVMTNSTAEISIRVKGDGFALRPKPVDVFMVTDRSGSMSFGNPSRMTLVKGAASSFKDLFNYTEDRAGQFSFGGITGTFKDYATLDQALTDKPEKIDAAIQALTPSGGTPLRFALYKAITELKDNGYPNSVKGLVVLSDGDYNYYGDPAALDSWRGKLATDRNPTDDYYYYELTPYWTEFPGLTDAQQNMSEYARENNIRIFTIGYSDSLTNDGQATLRDLAAGTNGRYYYALSRDDLDNFYGQIAGALKDTAGVNTTLSMDFLNVDVNGEVMGRSGVLEYMYIDGVSTRIKDPDGNVRTENSMEDWNRGRINVTMDTIKVNQEWMVNLTMKVTLDGNVKLLGSNSKVFFEDVNGVKGECLLPDTYVTSIAEGREKGLSTPTLTLGDLTVTMAEDMKTAHLAWSVSYENGMHRYIEEVIDVAPGNTEYYSQVGPTRVVTGYPISDLVTFSDAVDLDTSKRPPGAYRVKVTGRVLDADVSLGLATMTISEVPRKPEILIQ